MSLFIVGVAFLGLLVKHGSLRIPVCGESVAQLGVLCTREAFLLTCLPPPPVAAAAAAEPSMLPPPSSQPRRSTRELQRRLAATQGVECSLGASARRKARAAYRAALLPTCPLATLPLRVGSPRACSRAGAWSATRRIVAADHQLGLPLQVALSVQHRRPPSFTSAFSPSSILTVGEKTHEYCELFMIIRSLSIQSHDNSGADVFKLMIISVCCIQTQLIVFMPNAGV